MAAFCCDARTWSAAEVFALQKGLQELGWTEGRNVHFEFRWPNGDPDRTRAFAMEFVGLAPDVIVTGTTPAAIVLQRETRSIPVVFVNLADPVGTGLVRSLANPGGNMTGFTAFEFSITGKWLELLKEIAPRVTRVALNLRCAGGGDNWRTFLSHFVSRRQRRFRSECRIERSAPASAAFSQVA